MLLSNQTLNIQSSDITTPSQFLHSVRFNLKFKEPFETTELLERINNNKYISSTTKFDSNVIFELGRRFGAYGRLYSHAILNTNNILFDVQNHTIKGWAFIPQEGNTILSTLHSFMLQTGFKDASIIISKLKNELIRASW